MTRFTLSSILVMVFLNVVLNTGCAKDKPCKAIVTVLVSGTPLNGAEVRLEVLNNPSANPPLTTYTDASGKANYEVNLPQILDVVVIGFPATGKLVRFEQGKTDEVTVEF